MKLLTPTQQVSDKEKMTVINIKRSMDLDKELERKQRALEKVNIEYEIAIQRQTISLETEKGGYISQINALKEEVKLLEERKKEALAPLSEKEKELEKINEIIKKEKKRLNDKEQLLDENCELLMTKLTEVEDRELSANDMSQKQVLAQQGIDSQKEQIALQAQQFNDFAQKAIEDFKTKENYLNTKEAKIESQLTYIKTKLE